MSFREMRRNKQKLNEKETRAILERNTAGVLALLGDNQYPYAVPLSYVLDGDKMYFHSAPEGHKIDAVIDHPKASFCVIDTDEVKSEEFTTYYRSAIAFGKVRVIQSDEEKREAILKLSQRYSPNESAERTDQEINRSWNRLTMIEFTIEHLTGKQSIELVLGKE